MPSDFLTPFLELEDEFCKHFRGLDVTDGSPASAQTQRLVGFQRGHSLCPVTLRNSKFNSCSSVDPVVDTACWALGNTADQQWSLNHLQQQQLPRSSLNHIPFRVDRSVSMIESRVGHLGSCERQLLTTPAAPLMPPPGLSISAGSLSPPMSTRYKTEMCRTYAESGACKYGAKCQFAHGTDEVRGLSRHPRYKTEPCRTFHTVGFCPYGARCHFIHNADEQRGPGGGRPPPPPPQQSERPPLLRHSVSFAGFPSTTQGTSGFQCVPGTMHFSRASSVSPPPSVSPSPELLSPLLPEHATLKHSYPFSADFGNDQTNNNTNTTTARFYAITDSKYQSVLKPHRNAFTFTGLPALRRCASPDSLSDQEGYTSSSSLSGCESPGLEGRRLPIFSRLSVSDD
ncbi:hypothetical protein DPEC_G00299330 [Dallia pectoralis]|uniref:Uncharacterized protein n=1 Tax=Dallia pectoralis TaxID=75939 RepID=A0ACC2FG54_DALPE|nr:hypothetical protein DPEC_G00299330 [Dallia pectoralis]